MSFLKMLSGKNMGLIMSLLNGGTIDGAKIMELAAQFITDENVKGIVEALHLRYEKECAKLPEGDLLHLLLIPDPSRGLLLVFTRVTKFDRLRIPIKEIPLAQLTAEDIKQLLAGEVGNLDEKQEQPQNPAANTDHMLQLVNELEEQQHITQPLPAPNDEHEETEGENHKS